MIKEVRRPWWLAPWWSGAVGLLVLTPTAIARGGDFTSMWLSFVTVASWLGIGYFAVCLVLDIVRQRRSTTKPRDIKLR